MRLSILRRDLALVAIIGGISLTLLGCSDRADEPVADLDAAGVTVPGWVDREGVWAEPASVTCEGRMVDRRVVGDLLVPEGATCVLVRTLVSGRTTVDRDGSLTARGSFFGEGIGALSFRRVELSGERRPRRAPQVQAYQPDYRVTVTDFVFEAGRRLVLQSGADLSNARILVTQMEGPVDVRDIPFDLGSLTCLDNEVTPDVRRISAESPGALREQCAGLRNFGDSDF